MKIYKEVTRKEVDKTICDSCSGDVDKINEGSYVNILHEAHIDCFGVYENKYFNPDICAKCFVKKIRPFLESIGVEIKYE